MTCTVPEAAATIAGYDLVGLPLVFLAVLAYKRLRRRLALRPKV